MSPIRIALVVPDYTFTWDNDGQFCFSDLNQRCHAGEIDLVVFPESYESVPVADAPTAVAEWASTLGVPILMGVESEGFQLAVYHNRNPKEGDTSKHVYVKHSTADRLAFEWPGYQGAGDAMFLPIRLKRTNVGVHVCHDMFYGLVGYRLRQKGAQVLIDLTYGNVNLPKWRNIVRGRSLESAGPFLCTMAYDPKRKSGSAVALAYQAGKQLIPVTDTTGPNGYGGYTVFSLGATPEVDEVDSDRDHDGQAFSPQEYSDITLSLGTGKSADIMIRLRGPGIEVTGSQPGKSRGDWRSFANKAGKIGVLPMPLETLMDETAVHRLDAPEGSYDHHILLYYSPATGGRLRDQLSLMKLRAIEHRVGVALLAGDRREVLKTDRYKKIQRFMERKGIFGLNRAFLGGTWSTAGTGSSSGVPYERFPAYRALLGFYSSPSGEGERG
jgi:hypothetical protein